MLRVAVGLILLSLALALWGLAGTIQVAAWLAAGFCGGMLLRTLIEP